MMMEVNKKKLESEKMTKLFFQKSFSLQRGFIALITVLIILGIILMIGVGISFLSVEEASMGLQKSQSSQAYYLSNLCAEHALMKLKEDSSYTGNEIINIDNDNCQVLPIEGNWTIKVTANFQNQIKKMKIKVSQVSPKMVIDSWEEVAAF
jgi:type II secretory pathway component PulK